MQAVKLGNPAAFSKPVPKAEIETVVTFKLPELNLSMNEMLKSPFTTGTSIEQFLAIVKREVAAGNFMVAWHALPPKIQADSQEVLVKAFAVVGPSTIKQIQILLRDLNTIVQEKKEFIFNHGARIRGSVNGSVVGLASS